MKNRNFVLSITIALLISILACSLTSCRNVSDDLSSNISDISSVASTVEIDYFKIFNDKYISISENEKEDLESLENSKESYNKLLGEIDIEIENMSEEEKADYENLKERINNKISSIDLKISQIKAEQKPSTESTVSEVVNNNSNIDNSSETTQNTQDDNQIVTSQVVSSRPQKVDNPYTVDDFIFPEGSNKEVLYDENNKIYSLPYGTVITLNDFLDSNYFSSWEWKAYWTKYKWTEENTWEYFNGGTSMTKEEQIEWSKYGSEYLHEPNRDGYEIGEIVYVGVWVWMP